MVKYTPLCEIAYKYGTDKCPQLKHNYTLYYYDLFKDRIDTVKKVLEIGIGYYPGIKENPTNFDRALNRTYHRGASLLMWRDFFPNAQIHGADKQIDAMFSEDRITTHLCNTRKKEEIEFLIDTVGSDLDLFVDDGIHSVSYQAFLCNIAFPLLDEGAIYIIEDVRDQQEMARLLPEYDCFFPEIPHKKYNATQLAVIRKRK